MKKAVLAVLLLAVVVVFSGCEGLPLGGGEKEADVGYRTGTQGLVVSFMPNYPRTRMYDEESFLALLEVKNKGAYDVGFGGDRIYLSGFDMSIITGIPTSGAAIPQIEGKNQFNTEGGYDTVEFSGEIYPLSGKNIDKYPSTILATACYGYKTVASENICIDPDPFSQTGERKVCTPSTVSFGTQGAPIAVTSVEVEPTPTVTRFKIHLSNVGGGTAFKPGADYLAKCSPYHTEGLNSINEANMVQLSKVEVIGKSITPGCKPVDNQGHVRLINGQATVFCEIGGLGRGPAYSTPLTVEIDYGYRNTISKSVEILRTP